MRPNFPLYRAVPLLLVVAVAAASGCRWFRKDDAYAQSPESRPLEVPPDLDMPRTEGAMTLPPAGTTAINAGAAQPAATSAAVGFNLTGTREDAFAKVGEALDGIEGVTVASRAPLLGAYDVSYGGANFLVRVSATDTGVFVSAVDPRGLPAAGEAPAKLIGMLKQALGGQ
ncbi:hypothetical protein ACFOED_05260 [Vulcaniibacterium thermophilum]|uniref:Beta-barrel assembly machine subunit BamC n=1 Tax=Vulcaniibacterium thermophilum TaxID=1169913 RepID=A0A918YUK9_9GAMM|nr:hypothetical protein [Vulcaniibacterium thermophilum]GHE25448.1 hypothetical protein GCM10007167_02380 [Vulcaniibacterium thermophilum]